MLSQLDRFKLNLEKNYKLSSQDQEQLKFILVRPYEDLTIWHFYFNGAEGTIYEGDQFTLQLKFPIDYPHRPPEALFIDNIPVNQHIYSNGFICLDILYDQWSPALSKASTIFLSILSLLSEADEKKLPANNSTFIVKHQGHGPSDVVWKYEDNSEIEL